MSIKLNNVAFNDGGIAKFNNVSLSAIKYDATQVWQSKPTFLFDNGDQAVAFTGGWVPTPWYPFYGNASGRPNMMDIRNNYEAKAENNYLFIRSAPGDYNGQGMKPANQIDFTNLNSIGMIFQIPGGNFTYAWANITVGDVSQFVQYSNAGAIKTVGLHYQDQPLDTDLWISLDTRDITGKHDLIISVSCGESRYVSARVYRVLVG